MPAIVPFKAYYFDARDKKELEQLLAPPHDVISPAERSAYLRESRDNIVQIILPDSYPKAGEILNKLIETGRLIQQKSPAFYIYKTKHYQNGEMHERYGLLAIVKLSKFSEKQIIPHERTFKKVTEGRYNLFRETHANFNPIFFIFNGNHTYTKVIQKYKPRNPFLVVNDRDKVEHSVWVIDDALDIQDLQDSFQTIPLLIADGHHRYTSALMLSDENGSKYVLGLLVDMNDPNLSVFPTHRLVRYVSKINTHTIVNHIKKYFRFEAYDFSEPKMLNQLTKVLERIRKMPQNTFGLFLYNMNTFFLITLREEFPPESLIGGEFSNEWKRLDVSILHEFIFKQLLKIEQYIDDSENIAYIKNLEEAVQSVHNGLYQALFILNPTKVEQVLQITQGNEIMPHKSTYFYPKPLSGLIIYKWGPNEV